MFSSCPHILQSLFCVTSGYSFPYTLSWGITIWVRNVQPFMRSSKINFEDQLKGRISGMTCSHSLHDKPPLLGSVPSTKNNISSQTGLIGGGYSTCPEDCRETSRTAGTETWNWTSLTACALLSCEFMIFVSDLVCLILPTFLVVWCPRVLFSCKRCIRTMLGKYECGNRWKLMTIFQDIGLFLR